MGFVDLSRNSMLFLVISAEVRVLISNLFDLFRFLVSSSRVLVESSHLIGHVVNVINFTHLTVFPSDSIGLSLFEIVDSSLKSVISILIAYIVSTFGDLSIKEGNSLTFLFSNVVFFPLSCSHTGVHVRDLINLPGFSFRGLVCLEVESFEALVRFFIGLRAVVIAVRGFFRDMVVLIIVEFRDVSGIGDRVSKSKTMMLTFSKFMIHDFFFDLITRFESIRNVMTSNEFRPFYASDLSIRVLDFSNPARVVVNFLVFSPIVNVSTIILTLLVFRGVEYFHDVVDDCLLDEFSKLFESTFFFLRLFLLRFFNRSSTSRASRTTNTGASSAVSTRRSSSSSFDSTGSGLLNDFFVIELREGNLSVENGLSFVHFEVIFSEGTIPQIVFNFIKETDIGAVSLAIDHLLFTHEEFVDVKTDSVIRIVDCLAIGILDHDTQNFTGECVLELNLKGLRVFEFNLFNEFGITVDECSSAFLVEVGLFTTGLVVSDFEENLVSGLSNFGYLRFFRLGFALFLNRSSLNFLRLD